MSFPEVGRNVRERWEAGIRLDPKMVKVDPDLVRPKPIAGTAYVSDPPGLVPTPNGHHLMCAKFEGCSSSLGGKQKFDFQRLCVSRTRNRTGAEVGHKVLSILVCEEVNPAISGACFSSFLCGAEGGKVIPELEKKGPLGVGVGGTGTIRREAF